MLLLVASVGSLLLSQAGVPLDRAFDERPLSVGGEKYVGVTPGSEAGNPLPRARSAPPHLIWTGFQRAGEGGARVFIQTNDPVSYELLPAGKGGRTVSVLLRNCRLHMRNNARRLDARFFGTSVEEVVARQRRKDVQLTIRLKDAATPAARVEAGPQGTHFLLVEFGNASPPAGAATAAAGKTNTR